MYIVNVYKHRRSPTPRRCPQLSYIFFTIEKDEETTMANLQDPFLMMGQVRGTYETDRFTRTSDQLERYIFERYQLSFLVDVYWQHSLHSLPVNDDSKSPPIATRLSTFCRTAPTSELSIVCPTSFIFDISLSNPQNTVHVTKRVAQTDASCRFVSLVHLKRRE